MKNNSLPNPEKRKIRSTPFGELYEYRIKGEIIRKRVGKEKVVGDYSIRCPHIESSDRRVEKFNRFCKRVASGYADFAINRMKCGKVGSFTAILVFHLEFSTDRLLVSIRGYNGKVSGYELAEYRRLVFSLPDFTLMRRGQKRSKSHAY